ncbi:pirin family protein [Azohydromonas caseinilytica]|uniref:Pirin family protein n=1 Tax=Azohydromonas caseinilytica TaxID=2728836 RepID=A0A848F5V3_9BURK|nr:pirin family protein [Azohydromonas caseinilytica]NML15447.1 pirin family protein [Azohydromonas caseinilytica]
MDALETIVIPRSSDLGEGFTVRRALPSAARRMVGPFVFFDEMGPVRFEAGRGLDVRPHPHIGLATVTYLTQGEILHRDSLGVVQPIRPGELNWMTAGRGIVHSERTPPEARDGQAMLAGLQLWVALPRAQEEVEPSFVHHGAGELPQLEAEGCRLRVILGDFEGAHSPVRTLSEMFYVEVHLAPGAQLPLPPLHEERAAYVLSGQVSVNAEDAAHGHGPQQLLVFKPGEPVVLCAPRGPAHLVLLGGPSMDGPRYVWWNFVSSSRERIQQAQADWAAGRFAPVPQETEFIPLPENRPLPPVSYP